jgi:type I restriction enzyme S subunit
MSQSLTLFDEVESHGKYQNSRPVKIEDFPQEWEGARFGEVVASSQYGTSQASSENGVPKLGMGNIGDRGLDLSELSYVDPDEIDLDKYRLEKGDLLFNRTNSPDLVGKTALFDLELECVCASYLVQFNLDTDQLDPEYAHYFFQTDAAQRQLAALTTRGVSQANINPSHLERDFTVVYPSLQEQRRILETLNSWDRAIEQVDALIEQKRERLHGLRQRLLTGEVRFPEFDKPWVDEEIGSLLKRVYRYVDWDDEATYDLVSIKRDSQGMIFRESLKGSDIKTKTLNTLREGDFVISRMQVVHGATAYVSEEFDGMKASDSYIILVPRDEDRIDTEFFAELSKLPYLYHIAFTSSYGVHIEKMTFNLKWYFESEVQIPPKCGRAAKNCVFPERG